MLLQSAHPVPQLQVLKGYHPRSKTTKCDVLTSLSYFSNSEKLKDIPLIASLAGQAERGDLQVEEGDLVHGDLSGVSRVLCELMLESDGEDGGLDEEGPEQDGWGSARGH